MVQSFRLKSSPRFRGETLTTVTALSVAPKDNRPSKMHASHSLAERTVRPAPVAVAAGYLYTSILARTNWNFINENNGHKQRLPEFLRTAVCRRLAVTAIGRLAAQGWLVRAMGSEARNGGENHPGMA
jgi:hypothetical protein